MACVMHSRRAFLQHSTLCLAGFGAGKIRAAETDAKPLLRVGLMTDLHYADKNPTKTRFYREALAKLDEAVEVMNREKPAWWSNSAISSIRRTRWSGRSSG
jgi:hypothetical protein